MNIRPVTSKLRLGAATAALVVPFLLAGPAAAQTPTTEDPFLSQTITSGQGIGTGHAVIGNGHVDIGPTFVDGHWNLMVHDDSADPSVWRHPADAVLFVSDDALVDVPEDPQYDFLGATAGTKVHVVPQTQKDGVVWVGWNTQHPEVMQRIDRGVTLTMHQVQGPGQVSVYLQSGAFGAPEVLWSSAESDPQPFWVDVNTHTHANWVFTEPGVYLVRVEASADLLDGTAERSVEDLRFVVGEDIDPEAGFSAEADVPLDATATGGSDASAGSAPDSSDDAGDRGTGMPVALLIAGAVILAAGGAVGYGVVRGRRVRAEADRQVAASLPGDSNGQVDS